jgi:hypothetical protein
MSKPKIEWYKTGDGGNYKIFVECNAESVDSITCMLDALEGALAETYIFGKEDGEEA